MGCSEEGHGNWVSAGNCQPSLATVFLGKCATFARISICGYSCLYNDIHNGIAKLRL